MFSFSKALLLKNNVHNTSSFVMGLRSVECLRAGVPVFPNKTELRGGLRSGNESLQSITWCTWVSRAVAEEKRVIVHGFLANYDVEECRGAELAVAAHIHSMGCSTEEICSACKTMLMHFELRWLQWPQWLTHME